MIDEGYIKFDLDWTEGAPPPAEAVAELNLWRAPLYAAGLIGHDAVHDVGYGNISVRGAAAGEFIISGTQTGHVAETTACHYTRVTGWDIAGNRVCCVGPVRASSESMTHAALYTLDESIGAVVHVHSAALWRRWKGTLPTTRADVPYGTPAMAEEFARLAQETAFGRDGIAVMAGHEDGVLATGRDIALAARRILELHESLRETRPQGA